MKAVTAKNSSYLMVLCLLISLALAIPGIASGEADAAAYSFTATVLNATEDKEAIPEGTAVDDGGAGNIVTFGTVTKRWKEDKGVTSTEAAKNMGGGFLFNVKGNAEVTITVSSTGGDNTSAFAVVDESGAAVANSEGVGEVSGTGKQTFSYNLAAGAFRVVSPQSDYNRGVRIYSITVIDTPAPDNAIAEVTHSFTVGSLTAAEDKEAIAESTILDDDGLGYFTSSGNVVKRWKEDKGVTSVEVGKALSGCIVFTVDGEAEASVVVSSNGGDNEIGRASCRERV